MSRRSLWRRATFILHPVGNSDADGGSKPREGDRDHGAYQEGNAYHRIEAKESDIDPFKAAAAGDPVFEEEAGEDDQEGDKVGNPEAGEQSVDREQAPHKQVDKEGKLKRVFWAPADDEGMEAVGAVEVVVLDGIDDVEADQPADDGEREDDGRDVELPADGEPSADGSEGEGDAEVDVGEVGEALRERIKTDDGEGDGGEKEAEPVDEV